MSYSELQITKQINIESVWEFLKNKSSIFTATFS